MFLYSCHVLCEIMHSEMSLEHSQFHIIGITLQCMLLDGEEKLRKRGEIIEMEDSNVL